MMKLQELMKRLSVDFSAETDGPEASFIILTFSILRSSFGLALNDHKVFSKFMKMHKQGKKDNWREDGNKWGKWKGDKWGQWKGNDGFGGERNLTKPEIIALLLADGYGNNGNGGYPPGLIENGGNFGNNGDGGFSFGNNGNAGPKGGGNNQGNFNGNEGNGGFNLVIGDNDQGNTGKGGKGGKGGNGGGKGGNNQGSFNGNEGNGGFNLGNGNNDQGSAGKGGGKGGNGGKGRGKGGNNGRGNQGTFQKI